MKNKNKFIIILFILLIILFSMFFIIPQKEKNKICFNENRNCFNVEIASTQEELEKGLMFREFLNKDSGMLFIFSEEDFHSFWMKNTLIPLDIIWMNLDKEIIFIKHNTPPCLEEPCESFTSDEKALYVFEINSGIAEEIGLEIGEAVEFKIG